MSADSQTTETANHRSRLGIFLGEVIPVLLILALPVSVNAGVLTSLLEMLQQDVVIYEQSVHNVPVADLALLSATTNPNPTGAIGGGDVIVDDGALVAGGTLGDAETDKSKTFTGEISVYVVREGDTLSQIAEMFQVTSNTILWANDVKNGVIQPGDSLVILPIVGVRHVIKTGDTMSKIAKKYDADEDEIMEYNRLAALDDLTVGETLVIPGGEIAAPVRVASKSSSGGGSTSGGSSVGFSHPAPGAVRTQGIHGYNGVDLAGPGGARIPIRAAAAGQVIVSKGSGWNGGFGNYIVIKHSDGTQTLYAHLSSNLVGVGAYVGAGEQIGVMGNSGRSTGVHLHFEVRGARNPF